MHKIASIVAAFLVSGNIAANASPYVVTLEEVGSNVVATGSGNIDLTGLTLSGNVPNENSGVVPNLARLAVGGSSFTDLYSPSAPFSGPSSFGPGSSLTNANSESGSWVALGVFPNNEIGVPTGYSSDSPLGNSTAIYNNATFASLGVTPGIYLWTWGNRPDQRFELDIGVTAVPEPVAAPLFAAGLAALGLLHWRRKRKAQAI